MSERQKQNAFLKWLSRLDKTEAGRNLQERMAKAELDEKCIRRALFVVALLGLLSVSGLCYSAVLLPELFRNSSQFIIKAFCATGLGSLIGFLGFLTYWVRYRRASNRLHAECRRFVMSMLESRFKADGPALELRVVPKQDLEMYRVGTPGSAHGSSVLSLPKAS